MPVDRPDGSVDIVVIDILPQVHHGMGLSHANDALQVAHSNRHSMADCRLPPELCVHLQTPVFQEARQISGKEGIHCYLKECMSVLSMHCV